MLKNLFRSDDLEETDNSHIDLTNGDASNRTAEEDEKEEDRPTIKVIGGEDENKEIDDLVSEETFKMLWITEEHE